jgi:RimJ/RimL family protein N-acetyltransferase
LAVSFNLVFGKDDEVAEWLSPRLNQTFAKPFTAIGGMRDGVLVAAWLFSHYNGRNIEISVAADGHLNRGFVYAAVDYVFNQLKCRRASCHVSTLNHKSISFIERIGWRWEGYSPLWYEDDSPALCYGIRKEDCARWLKRLGK